MFIVLYGALVTRLSPLSAAHCQPPLPGREQSVFRTSISVSAKVSSCGRDAPTPGSPAAVTSPPGPRGGGGALAGPGTHRRPLSSQRLSPQRLLDVSGGRQEPLRLCVLPPAQRGTAFPRGLCTSHRRQPGRAWTAGPQEGARAAQAGEVARPPSPAGAQGQRGRNGEAGRPGGFSHRFYRSAEGTVERNVATNHSLLIGSGRGGLEEVAATSREIPARPRP